MLNYCGIYRGGRSEKGEKGDEKGDSDLFSDLFKKKVAVTFLTFLVLLLSVIPQQAAAQEVQPGPGTDRQGVRVSVLIEGVYDASVSVIRFTGSKADYENPVGETPGIKDGETAVLTVPPEYLPGEFVLRLDYRAKEEDYPYPSERIIFLNDQDIALTVNPPYINNDMRTKFQDGERENTVYVAFMRENAHKRQPVEALRQFLLAYDRPQAKVYREAVKEFEQRRRQYNAWLKEQTKERAGLFVSRLFQFYYIPAVDWSGDNKARTEDMLAHYFDGIDFSDPLIIRSREFTKFLDQYMRLSAMRSQTKKRQQRLLIQAGDALKAAASQGHPQVQAWIHDYLRKGYEAQGI